MSVFLNCMPCGTLQCCHYGWLQAYRAAIAVTWLVIMIMCVHQVAMYLVQACIVLLLRLATNCPPCPILQVLSRSSCLTECFCYEGVLLARLARRGAKVCPAPSRGQLLAE